MALSLLKTALRLLNHCFTWAACPADHVCTLGQWPDMTKGTTRLTCCADLSKVLAALPLACLKATNLLNMLGCITKSMLGSTPWHLWAYPTYSSKLLNISCILVSPTLLTLLRLLSGGCTLNLSSAASCLPHLVPLAANAGARE